MEGQWISPLHLVPGENCGRIKTEGGSNAALWMGAVAKAHRRRGGSGEAGSRQETTKLVAGFKVLMGELTPGQLFRTPAGLHSHYLCPSHARTRLTPLQEVTMMHKSLYVIVKRSWLQHSGD